MVASVMKVTEILRQYAAGVRDFSAVKLTGINLSDAFLSGVNLSDADLSVANLSGANLSCTDLSRAYLGMTNLSGANLSQATLTQTNLNAANLTRADLKEAQLTQSLLIRAELRRADLTGANFEKANLSGADLQEADLRQAKLSNATLNQARFRGALLIAAVLEEASLNGADLSRADLRGSDLRHTELKKANLSRANLSGANLSGANLRWADLSGANLSWADLSHAKLTGANLIGANLSNANLPNASLVHADLTHARLIKANWIGADLTSATVTGAKLYAVSRFGLKTEGIICDWVDMSPDGDRREIVRLSIDDSKKFFNETLPTVQIVVDAPLDLNANLALVSTYHQIARIYPTLIKAPSVEVGVRRTTLTFTGSNAELFIIAYLAILPFKDATVTHHNIVNLLSTLRSQNLDILGSQDQERIGQLITTLSQTFAQIDNIKLSKITPEPRSAINFFEAPTHTVVTNSSDQTLNVYEHPAFGKHLLDQSSLFDPCQSALTATTKPTLPPVATVVEFIKTFEYPACN